MSNGNINTAKRVGNNIPTLASLQEAYHSGEKEKILSDLKKFIIQTTGVDIPINVLEQSSEHIFKDRLGIGRVLQVKPTHKEAKQIINEIFLNRGIYELQRLLNNLSEQEINEIFKKLNDENPGLIPIFELLFENISTSFDITINPITQLNIQSVGQNRTRNNRSKGGRRSSKKVRGGAKPFTWITIIFGILFFIDAVLVPNHATENPIILLQRMILSLTGLGGIFEKIAKAFGIANNKKCAEALCTVSTIAKPHIRKQTKAEIELDKIKIELRKSLDNERAIQSIQKDAYLATVVEFLRTSDSSDAMSRLFQISMLATEQNKKLDADRTIHQQRLASHRATMKQHTDNAPYFATNEYNKKTSEIQAKIDHELHEIDQINIQQQLLADHAPLLDMYLLDQGNPKSQAALALQFSNNTAALYNSIHNSRMKCSTETSSDECFNTIVTLDSSEHKLSYHSTSLLPSEVFSKIVKAKGVLEARQRLSHVFGTSSNTSIEKTLEEILPISIEKLLYDVLSVGISDWNKIKRDDHIIEVLIKTALFNSGEYEFTLGKIKNGKSVEIPSVTTDKKKLNTLKLITAAVNYRLSEHMIKDILMRITGLEAQSNELKGIMSDDYRLRTAETLANKLAQIDSSWGDDQKIPSISTKVLCDELVQSMMSLGLMIPEDKLDAVAHKINGCYTYEGILKDDPQCPLIDMAVAVKLADEREISSLYDQIRHAIWTALYGALLAGGAYWVENTFTVPQRFADAMLNCWASPKPIRSSAPARLHLSSGPRTPRRLAPPRMEHASTTRAALGYNTSAAAPSSAAALNYAAAPSSAAASSSVATPRLIERGPIRNANEHFSPTTVISREEFRQRNNAIAKARARLVRGGYTKKRKHNTKRTRRHRR